MVDLAETDRRRIRRDRPRQPKARLRELSSSLGLEPDQPARCLGDRKRRPTTSMSRACSRSTPIQRRASTLFAVDLPPTDDADDVLPRRLSKRPCGGACRTRWRSWSHASAHRERAADAAAARDSASRCCWEPRPGCVLRNHVARVRGLSAGASAGSGPGRGSRGAGSQQNLAERAACSSRRATGAAGRTREQESPLEPTVSPRRKERAVETLDGALGAAEEIGYPVVLKTAARRSPQDGAGRRAARDLADSR